MPRTKQFEELLKNVRKTYLGKEVNPKYKKKYGKIYNKNEIESVAFAIASKRGIKIEL